jgi:hypothetical protein
MKTFAKTFALLFMTMTIGTHARVLEDAPAPAPSAAAALYGYTGDMVLQEGGVDDAPPNNTPPNSRGLQLSNDHKMPEYKFATGTIIIANNTSKGKRVFVIYMHNNKTQSSEVTKSHVCMGNTILYTEAPEEIKNLKTNDTVEVMFYISVSISEEFVGKYILYRIFVNDRSPPSHGMVLQEGGVDDAPPNITPPNTRGLLQLSNDHKTNDHKNNDHIIFDPCTPNYQYFKGEIYRRKGNVYVFYSPHNEEQVDKVTKDQVNMRYNSTHGELLYKAVPWKIHKLRTGDIVQVMASSHCKNRKGYGLYRIFINARSR